MLQQLLKFDPPRSEQRQVPCCCGYTAKYLELRPKLVLSVVGEVQCVRPYFLCERCHVGQFPVDVELDIAHTELSPGVRRMQALVGQQAPFDHGREQMQILAGLEVTTKSVERTAEAMGDDIVLRENKEIQKALQLDLPVITGEPILYVQMDGTGVPVVKKETAGRQGKTQGLPAHTREAKLGCVFTQTTWDREGYAIGDPDSTPTPGPSKPRWSLANASIEKRGNAVGAVRRRRWSSAMAPNGSGILSPNTFRTPSRLSKRAGAEKMVVSPRIRQIRRVTKWFFIACPSRHDLQNGDGANRGGTKCSVCLVRLRDVLK